MTKPETRGYLVGLNESQKFEIPHNLMTKIVQSTGETVLMLWIPYKRTLQLIPVETTEVVKLTVWFSNITTTVFNEKLDPLLNEFNDVIIYKTGVLFPEKADELISVEYYLKPELKNRVNDLENRITELDVIENVEKRILQRYEGDDDD